MESMEGMKPLKKIERHLLFSLGGQDENVPGQVQ